MIERKFAARWIAWLEAPQDAAALGVVRFLVGCLVAVSAARLLIYGWVDSFFVTPRFHFKHWGFDWVPVPGPFAVHVLVWATLALGVLVALGLFHRVAVVLLAGLFTWVQLLDATNYLNHYYLVSLLLALMALMPLGGTLGLDALIWPAKRVTALPRWMTVLLRFQVGIVYLFAAKAKLGSDWLLHAQPLNIWLAARADTPLVGPWLGRWEVALAMSWAGFLFDGTIVLWLSLARTRAAAFAVLVLFHAVTGYLFPIGMFPVIMVCATTVFFPSDWPRRFLGRVADPPAIPPSRLRPGSLALLAAYAAVQILVPLRAHLYGGNVLWHEQGMRFAWRVLTREKNAAVTYHLEDRATGRTWFVRPRKYLDARQEREFGTQPDLILQLAHHIARDAGPGVSVRAEVLVSLNGRRPQLLVDPAIDLTQVEDGVARATWVLPAPEESPPRLGFRK
jgi:vitamin K-dependent gamma-carboxylase